MRTLALILLSVASLYAADYYVSTTGDNGNPGTEGSPWRTIQKAADTMLAGDTVYVAAGTYNEHVELLRSNQTFVGTSLPVTLNWGVKGSSNTISGFHMMYGQMSATNVWDSYIYLFQNGSHFTATNCFFGPSCGVISTGLLWETFSTNKAAIHSPGWAWTNYGFQAGTRVFVGGSSQEEHWFANHDRAVNIDVISNDVMWLTHVNKPMFTNETNTSAWAPIYPGGDYNGFRGVRQYVSGPTKSDNLTIINCTFSNLFGTPVDLSLGTNHLIQGNKFTKLNSWYGTKPNGTNVYYISNFWVNCHYILNYTGAEIDSLPHPAGASWYDYQNGFIHSTSHGSNIVFAWNWIEDIHNQLCQINEDVSGDFSPTNFTMVSNVFVGCALYGGGGRNGFKWLNNTFYKCAYDIDQRNILSIGGNTPARLASNIMVLSNVFIDVGDHSATTLEGCYAMVNTTNSVGDWNFACAPESMGWIKPPYLTDTNGIGGNPLLWDMDNPRGPDGLPFTDDDGLRPRPESPLTTYGLGALTARTNAASTSFRAESTLNTGWLDPTGLDYNPSWTNDAPFLRTNKVRVWWTPEKVTLGYVPCKTVFIADQYNMEVGFGLYDWDFGDGAAVRLMHPIVDHAFLWAATNTISLTATNNLGQLTTFSRDYIVRGQSNYPYKVYHVKTDGSDASAGTNYATAWLTLTKAIATASDGDFVAVHDGYYDQYPRLNTTAPKITNRIELHGFGARTRGFYIERPYWTVQGFFITNAGSAGAGVLIKGTQTDDLHGHWAHFRYNTIANLGYQKQASYIYTSGGDPWVTNVVFQGNLASNLGGINIEWPGASNCTVASNMFMDSWAEGDTFRFYGASNRFIANWAYNMSSCGYNSTSHVAGGHPDLMQIAGGSAMVKNTLVERNWFVGGVTNPFPKSTIQVTNTPQNGDYVTIQGVTYTWTNDPSSDPTRLIQIGASQAENGTNIYNTISSNPPSPGLVCYQYDDNGIGFKIYYESYDDDLSGTAYPSGATPSWGFFANDALDVSTAIGQMASGQIGAATTHSNWVIRNNVFYKMRGQLSDSIDGLKIYNNLFYRAPSAYAATTTGGGANGSSYGTEIFNNIFFEVGFPGDTGVNKGWYQNGLGVSYTTVEADYNVVVGTNGQVKLYYQDPGDLDGFHWAIPGQEMNGMNGTNPMFLDPARLDFRLSADSPLIDAATNSPLASEDLLGRTRSGTYDIGPFEGSYSEASLDPALSRTPSSLLIYSLTNTTPANSSYQLWNSGGGSLVYTNTSNVSWLALSPVLGTNTGAADTITVSFDADEISHPSTNNGLISINWSGTPETISVQWISSYTNEAEPQPVFYKGGLKGKAQLNGRTILR